MFYDALTFAGFEEAVWTQDCEAEYYNISWRTGQVLMQWQKHSDYSCIFYLISTKIALKMSQKH